MATTHETASSNERSETGCSTVDEARDFYEAERELERQRQRDAFRAAYERFMGINPFYWASALLLLFGIYRLSVNDKAFRDEWVQLSFNFGALQLYELLAVGAAVFLARRKIWYETVFLVCIESLLALVAFILISHAVFIDRTGATALALAGVALVCGRFVSLKLRIPALNISWRLLWFGAGILAVNAIMAPWFRSILEHNNEGWKQIDRTLWILILPGMLALVNCLPRIRRESSEESLVQKSWLPYLLLLTWVAVSIVHVYSIGYVDDRKFSWSTFSVTVWVAAWTLVLKLNEVLPSALLGTTRFIQALPYAALVLPMDLLPGLSRSVPALLTAAGYGLLSRHAVHRAYTLPLAIGSLILAATPEGIRHSIFNGLTQGSVIAVGIGWPFLCSLIRQRTPRASLALGIWTAVGIVAAFFDFPQVISLAFQGGVAAFLMHSMRWTGIPATNAKSFRQFIELMWIMHAFATASSTELLRPIIGFGLMTGLVAAIHFWRTNGTEERRLLISAATVAMACPIEWAVKLIWNAPLGILSLISAFFLLILGTSNAIKRWTTARLATVSLEKEKLL